MLDIELERQHTSLDGNIGEEEHIATNAAIDFCIPQTEFQSFYERKAPYISEQDVVGFARRLRIHPGLVVGQVQFRTGRWNYLRKHQVKVRSHLQTTAFFDGWGTVAPVTL